MRTEINRLIAEDIIEPSYSPYTSPILAVPKEHGKVRICLDAREINKHIVNDRTSPAEIEEIPKSSMGQIHQYMGHCLRLLTGRGRRTNVTSKGTSQTRAARKIWRS